MFLSHSSFHTLYMFSGAAPPAPPTSAPPVPGLGALALLAGNPGIAPLLASLQQNGGGGLGASGSGVASGAILQGAAAPSNALAPAPGAPTSRKRASSKCQRLSVAGDDAERLTNSYRNWGGLWRRNNRAIIPKKLRASCINKHDPDRFTPVMLNELGEDETDELSYVLSNLPPSTRISDLCCTTKGGLREAFLREVRRTMGRYPHRLAGLAADCSNVGLYAHQLGLPLSEYSPARLLALGLQAPQAEEPTAAAAALPAKLPLQDAASDMGDAPAATSAVATAADADQDPASKRPPLRKGSTIYIYMYVIVMILQIRCSSVVVVRRFIVKPFHSLCTQIAALHDITLYSAPFRYSKTSLTAVDFPPTRILTDIAICRMDATRHSTSGCHISATVLYLPLSMKAARPSMRPRWIGS